MANKSAHVAPRDFNSISASALSDEARKAVNAAFEAMSVWRTEIVDNGEKNTEQVIEKIAEAARALGWPVQIVDATRLQMQTVTKMQTETIDNMMDAWAEQTKSPTSSAAISSKIKSFSDFASAGGWPGADVSQMAQWSPFGFYMQIAEQWRKAWADVVASWSKVSTGT
jgi:hypothetical protein